MGDFTNNLNKKNNSMQKQVNIDISKTKLVRCECGNPYYQQVVIFREVSGILMGQGGKNVHQPQAVLICTECKKPHASSIPYLIETKEEEKPVLEIVK